MTKVSESSACCPKLKAELPGMDGDAVDRAKSILLAIAAKDDNQQDWRSDLVGNTVCADLLAYITTDAAWTGIEKRPGYYSTCSGADGMRAGSLTR